MHPRTSELLQYLDEQFEHLRATLNAVPPEKRDHQPAPDKWSAANVISHLAIVEQRLAGMIGKVISDARAKGIPPETETSPIEPKLDFARLSDRTRPITASDATNPLRGADPLTWSDYENARAHLKEVIVESDGLALGTVVHPHPVFGPLNLHDWVFFVGAHGRRHADQIRELAS